MNTSDKAKAIELLEADLQGMASEIEAFELEMKYAAMASDYYYTNGTWEAHTQHLKGLQDAYKSLASHIEAAKAL